MNKDEQEKRIDVTKKVLDAIEDFKMKPKPKWHFVVQDAVVWSLGIMTTFFGAITVSVSLFALTIAPARFYLATHESIVKFWFEFIPVLWLVLFIAFIFATDYLLRKTKRGYKYSFIILTLASIFLSVLLGTVGFFVGLGKIVEERVGPHVPFHVPPQIIMERIWSQPGKGLLTGTLSEDKTSIKTKEGIVFELDTSGLPVIQKDLIQRSTSISLIGTTTSSNIFYVCVIIPFENKAFLLDTTQFERKILDERTNTCKGVRPYDRLKTKILNYEN